MIAFLDYNTYDPPTLSWIRRQGNPVIKEVTHIAYPDILVAARASAYYTALIVLSPEVSKDFTRRIEMH